MTPEVTQQVSRLRREFYTHFANILGTEVTIGKEKSYASTLPKASWTDSQQRLNYLCMYAYSAPDSLIPDRPLVLRIGVNLGAQLLASPRRGKGIRRYNQTCQFYLTLSPDEVQGLTPWLLAVLDSETQPRLTTMAKSPYQLVKGMSTSAAPSFWTYSAQQCAGMDLDAAFKPH